MQAMESIHDIDVQCTSYYLSHSSILQKHINIMRVK